MSEEIFKRIDILAAKLNVTANKIFEVLVRQAKVEAISDCFFFTLMSIGLYVAYVVCRYALKKEEEAGDGLGYAIVSVIGGLLCFILWCLTFNAMLTELFNPQYWALKQLMDLIK